jgi:hypothetical protein
LKVALVSLEDGSIKFQWRLKFSETSLFSKRCWNLVDKVFVDGARKKKHRTLKDF